VDGFAFISTLVSALAWPTVAIVIVLFLRKPMADLLPLLQRLKYRDMEVVFGNRIAEVKAEVVALANEQQIAHEKLIGRDGVDPYSIRIKHISKWVDERSYSVRVWLDAPSEFLSSVNKVIYERPDAAQGGFSEAVVSPFENKFECQVESTIWAVIKLKNGEKLRRQRFLARPDRPAVVDAEQSAVAKRE